MIGVLCYLRTLLSVSGVIPPLFHPLGYIITTVFGRYRIEKKNNKDFASVAYLDLFTRRRIPEQYSGDVEKSEYSPPTNALAAPINERGPGNLTFGIGTISRSHEANPILAYIY